MTKSERQWRRLQGRWLIAAYTYWDRKLVFYRRQKLPTPKLTNAHSFATRAQARNVMRYINKGNPRLRWFPYEVKDTELFLEVMK